MRYPDLRPALEAYARGENVARSLRELLGVDHNTPEIIELAYDLQAGSYVAALEGDRERWTAYVGELADVLRGIVRAGDRVLDAGTGELTTLAGVAPRCFGEVAGILACDLSWSRLRVGLSFFRGAVGADLAGRLEPFVADLRSLPLATASVDVVWTSHAVEPNGGREREIVAELLRVARRRLVLFEPSYELNTPEGRARMDAHGYARGLPEAIAAAGGRSEAPIPIRSAFNPLNPTHAYVVTPPSRRPAASPWACPSTGLPLVRRAGCFFSEGALLAYPVLDGVPVLRPEAAILASALR